MYLRGLFIGLTFLAIVAVGSNQFTAIAKFQAKNGSQVEGLAVFTEDFSGLKMQIDAEGFAPGSRQTLQVHIRGNCDAYDASSAGGVFYPKGLSPSERKNFTAGNLGTLRADGNGKISKALMIRDISIQVDSPVSILGKALVIHSKQEPLTTRPVSTKSRRIACAVIH